MEVLLLQLLLRGCGSVLLNAGGQVSVVFLSEIPPKSKSKL